LVRTINEYQSVSEFANTIISTPEGRPVYLRDVASVAEGEKERQAITRLNGVESVELAVYKEGDANTVQVAEKVKARVEAIKETMPDDMDLQVVYDQSGFISSAIGQVGWAGLFGVLLAVAVLYFFLRDARSTFVIALAIPVSIIGTFVLMYASELSLNIMSLGGIALAVGLLVDNAIVVLENIVRKKEQGLPDLEAAQTGTSEVGTAIVAATLTTVAVFFPMVFVSGIAGQLFRDQALTVTFALLFSLLVALTLIPMLAAGKQKRFTADAQKTPEKVGWFTKLAAGIHTGRVKLFALIGKLFRWLLTPFVVAFQKLYETAAAVYAPSLRWSLTNRLVVLLVAGGILTGAVSLIPRLGMELIPQLSQGEFIVDLRLQPGTPLAQTDLAMRAAQSAAQRLPNLETAYSVAGTGNRLDANPVDAGEHSGTLNITLKPGATRADEDRAMAQLREDFQRIPGIQYEFSRPSLLNVSAPLEIEVTGYDLERLSEVSEQIVRLMEDSNRFVDIRSSVEIGNPEVQILFDHDRAANLGLVVRDVADTVVSNVRGDVATRYTWRDRKIDVLVRSVDTRNSSVAEISQLIINPASDRPVTLDAVADINIEAGPAEIRRLDQERVALITANLAFGDLGSAVQELEQTLSTVPMPRGVATQVSGQSEEMQESILSMQFALAMAIFLVYLVMASQFESLIHPFVILFTIPLALVGAIFALYITGTTLNVVAFIGIIMLAGIVVNNAIVLVDFVNQLRTQGQTKFDALIEAGNARLRPILMTTLTTALGLLPMAIGFGEGAEVRAPMAITVIGGLLVSTLLTLIVIPVVYSLMDRDKTVAS
ncbi:MAG: efflux RND transporter permease subunit, partial [Pseudomonadota bacterium]